MQGLRSTAESRPLPVLLGIVLIFHVDVQTSVTDILKALTLVSGCENFGNYSGDVRESNC